MTWNFDFNDTGIRTLEILFSTLSLFGSSALVLYCSMKKNKTISCRLNIICLGIADFFFSLSNLLSFAEKPNSLVDRFCIFEATIRLWSWHLSLIFATSIAVSSYLKASLSSFDLKTTFQIILYGSSLIILILNFMAFIPHRTGVGYFNSQIMCLVYYDQTDPEVSLSTKILVATFYDGVFFLICFFVTLFSYCKSIKIIRNLHSQEQIRNEINELKLLYYPAMMIISFAPYIFNNYYQIFASSSPLWLLKIHIALNHPTGWMNALVYGTQRRNSDRLSEVSMAIQPTPTPTPYPRSHDDSFTTYLFEAQGDIYTGERNSTFIDP